MCAEEGSGPHAVDVDLAAQLAEHGVDVAPGADGEALALAVHAALCGAAPDHAAPDPEDCAFAARLAASGAP